MPSQRAGAAPMMPIDEHRFAAIPFLADGRTMAGADCWGFARLVAAQFGVALPLHNDVEISDRGAVEGRIRNEIRGGCEVVGAAALRGGDLVHMWALEDGRRLDLHVGVMIGARRMMHMEEGRGVGAVPVDHRSVAMRILGFYRYREGAS